MRTLPFTVYLFEWLSDLAFLGHVLSLGYERLRRDAGALRATLPATAQRDGRVLADLTDGFAHLESIQRGFSPNQLIDGSADDHRRTLNQLLLFEVCAAFERWASEASNLITPALPPATRKALQQRAHTKTAEVAIEKALQFPDSAVMVVAELAKVARRGTPRGLDVIRERYRKAIVRARGAPSAPYRTQVRFRELLRGYLTVYRAHKELRNSLVHASRRVGQAFEDQRMQHDSLDPTALGLRELPRLIPLKAGDAATVSLRGVFGLMQIVKRSAEIIDGYMN